jgi:hypothetical protein
MLSPGNQWPGVSRTMKKEAAIIRGLIEGGLRARSGVPDKKTDNPDSCFSMTVEGDRIPVHLSPSMRRGRYPPFTPVRKAASPGVHMAQSVEHLPQSRGCPTLAGKPDQP